MFDAVIFVSLGPGDPELVTLKGLKALQQADVIFCPSTGMSSRAMDILSELGIDKTKIELFPVPMNKDRSQAITAYEEVAKKTAGYFNDGIKVAITAEGDAGFYSSIHYINDNLQLQNIPTKKIAGVPAFIACGALANLHIVKQENELIVIPGITTSKHLRTNITAVKTVVIMKPSQCESAIKEILSEKDITFHYFENAGLPKKEYYTKSKEDINKRTFPYFSLLIIQKD